MRIERGQHELAGSGQVVGRAGPDVGDPQRKAAGVGEDLHAAAEGVVLAGVPHVVTALGAGGHTVGGHQRAVQAEEGQPGGAGLRQGVLRSGACAAMTSSASRR